MTKARRLTDKQEAFAQAYWDSASATEAYRKVYNAQNMAPNTVHTEAHRLLHHPQVAHKIQEIRDTNVELIIWNKVRLMGEIARNQKWGARTGNPRRH